ncbi:MAG: substrate-binding domain-containing protein [Bacteroidetes bacterium]|nr:substrate-binding domain-containing protein [Bacteroidota bacterium]MBU1422729.1 substrate-binding domain-containing protein [Bacteroidota bacterium]MBU2471665.1 substrate-binding domain-containing protein [Bacteroidota bacterium]MBU2635491.1 substrate-binding domain-containing protein [Bacteroidota bacterium]
MKSKHFILFAFAVLLLGCDSGEEKESPTKGRLVFSVSETIAPMAKQMAAKFENIYEDSKIDINVVSAREAIVHLLNDSVEIIIISRSLNEEEQSVVDKAGLNVRQVEIAVGGFIVITNKQNPVKGLRVSQLDSIYDGRITRWSELGWKNSTALVKFFIPDRNSDVYESMQKKFSPDKALPKYFFPLSSSDSVIQAVSITSNAMGMIGLNYYDTTYSGIKFLELSDRSELSDSLGVSGLYFSPAQAFVYRKHYPLWTPVYIYSNIKSVGLASGFISFISSVQGQKIVLNNGLVPATMPVRIIQLNRGE